jgi:hypothetical protein
LNLEIAFLLPEILIRPSLATLFFQGILIFPRENKLISLGKIKTPWKYGIAKLALNMEKWKGRERLKLALDTTGKNNLFSWY